MSQFLFFFFNDTATTEIYTLSLHDALPISLPLRSFILINTRQSHRDARSFIGLTGDRQGTPVQLHTGLHYG